MGTLEDLRDVYEKFSSFGSSRTLAGPLDHGDVTIDGAKFAKFARDNKIIDNKKITSTDVDITFNKVKAKGARKLDFNGFCEALTLLAEKKHAPKTGRDALDVIIANIVKRGGGPINTGTIAQSDDIVDRLTDTTTYTGTHKARFDEEGKGRGLAGRDQPSRTDQLSKITNREETSLRGLPVTADPNSRARTQKSGSNERLGSKSSLGGSRGDLSRSKSNMGSYSNLSKSKSLSNSSINEKTKRAYATSTTSGSVFDRLTDSSGYTGSHKLRFNADGTGRGAAGRDAPSKSADPGSYAGGDVKALGQILRN